MPSLGDKLSEQATLDNAGSGKTDIKPKKDKVDKKKVYKDSKGRK